MNPREFLNTIVRLNVADFHREYGNLRHAYNAVAAVDALAAHIYVWCRTNATAHVNGIVDDTAYRATLAGQNQIFSLLHDKDTTINTPPETTDEKIISAVALHFQAPALQAPRCRGHVFLPWRSPE